MTNPQRRTIHLDTDIGGDTDDLCALAMLLGLPEIELVGITTVADRDGRRAAFVRHALGLAGRSNVPVASGAFGFLGGMAHEPGIQDANYWPGMEPASAGPPGEAVDLICKNAEAGAMVVAIGPYTNLALVETLRPGLLGRSESVVMGGCLNRPGPGLPQWGPEMDYNVQADRIAAALVFEHMTPLIVPIDVSMSTWLRRADLARLRQGVPIAQLVARQAELYGVDNRMSGLAARHPGLPPDLLNFQHDPLACAAALGWDCVAISEVRLAPRDREGSLVLEQEAKAPLFRVVTGVDTEAFSSRWIEAVMRADLRRA